MAERKAWRFLNWAGRIETIHLLVTSDFVRTLLFSLRPGVGRYGDAAAINRATRKWRRYLYLASVGSNSAVRALR
jgi:hypothetical protein